MHSPLGREGRQAKAAVFPLGLVCIWPAAMGASYSEEGSFLLS